MKKIYSFAILMALTGASFGQKLIAHYPLNGNANDTSGNNLHGVVTGAVGTTNKDELANSAMLFSSMSDKIVVNDTEPFNLGLKGSVTISAWFNIGTSKEQCAIFHSGTDAWQTGMLLGLNWAADKIIFGVGAAGFLNTSNVIGFSSKNKYTDGLWHHVVVTVDSLNNAAKMYVDGSVVKIEHYDAFGTTGGQITSDSTVQTLAGVEYDLKPSASKITIGNSTNYQYFAGKIDELKIYNKALNAEQINTIYTGGALAVKGLNNDKGFSLFPNPSTGQVAFYSVNAIENISVYSLQGELIYTNLMNATQANIALDLPAGLYIVKASSGDDIITEKLIVE